MSAQPADPGESAETSRPTTAETVSTSISFTGPLPPPGFLQRYEEISPGLAERLVRYAEGEAEHRRAVEKLIVETQCGESRAYHAEVKRGQVCAVVITLAALAAGAYTAVNGQPLAGGVLGTAGVTGIVMSLVLGRKASQEQHTLPAQTGAKRERRRAKK